MQEQSILFCSTVDRILMPFNRLGRYFGSLSLPLSANQTCGGGGGVAAVAVLTLLSNNCASHHPPPLPAPIPITVARNGR